MSFQFADPPVARFSSDAFLRLPVAPVWALFVFQLPKEPA